LTFALIAFIFLVGFSRVFLGEHGINQVVYGGSVGTFFAIIMHFRVKPYFDQLPQLFGNLKRRIATHTNQPLSWVSFYVLVFFIMTVVPLVVSVTIWSIQKANHHLEPEWVVRIDQFCPVRHGMAAASQFDAVLMQTSIIALASGCLLGGLYELKFHPHTAGDYQWYHTSGLKTFGRILITSLVSLFIILPMSFASVEDEAGVLVTTFVTFLVPMFVGPFLLFAFGRTLFDFLKLSNPVSEHKGTALYDEEQSLTLQKKLLTQDQ